jgi:hypothetical protein
MTETDMADVPVEHAEKEQATAPAPIESNEIGALEPVVIQPAKASRPRNYSFLHKKIEHLDEVDVDGVKHPIPAHIGSTYWAILKVCYERANKPVYESELPDLVDELMLDRDAASWEAYKNKGSTTVHQKGQRVIKPAKSWQERVVNNAKTLTRQGGNSQYGKRLVERGHVLLPRYDAKMKPYFILSTSLDAKELPKKDSSDE